MQIRYVVYELGTNLDDSFRCKFSRIGSLYFRFDICVNLLNLSSLVSFKYFTVKIL